MLLKRFVVALILLPLAIYLILYAKAPNAKLVLNAMLVVAAWEWAGLCGWQSRLVRIAFTLVAAIYFLLATNTLPVFGVFLRLPIKALPLSMYLIFLSTILWISVTIYTFFYPALIGLWKSKLLRILMALIIFNGVIASCFVLFTAVVDGRLWLLLCCIIAWTADTGAYFAGKRWGNRKLAPHISPGKTWEGVVGGLVVSLIAGLIAAYVLNLNMSYRLVPLIIVTMLAALIGDLSISMLKRTVHLKDTGSLLPGHGGLLDRIDSLLAALPVFTLGMYTAMPEVFALHG